VLYAIASRALPRAPRRCCRRPHAVLRGDGWSTDRMSVPSSSREKGARSRAPPQALRLPHIGRPCEAAGPRTARPRVSHRLPVQPDRR
jgi:hypothetical protein